VLLDFYNMVFHGALQGFFAPPKGFSQNCKTFFDFLSFGGFRAPAGLFDCRPRRFLIGSFSSGNQGLARRRPLLRRHGGKTLSWQEKTQKEGNDAPPDSQPVRQRQLCGHLSRGVDGHG
jgi:hypothetical protein